MKKKHSERASLKKKYLILTTTTTASVAKSQLMTRQDILGIWQYSVPGFSDKHHFHEDGTVTADISSEGLKGQWSLGGGHLTVTWTSSEWTGSYKNVYKLRERGSSVLTGPTTAPNKSISAGTLTRISD